LMGFSFYLNSMLSIDSEHQYIMSSLYIRGFSMGLIFSQLSTVSLMTIPREKMAQASSITNTVRQVGGSLGVALMSTVYSTRVQYHIQVFGNAIQSASPQFNKTLNGLVNHIQAVGGSSHAMALKQAQSILFSSVSKQAIIQGIDDDFLLAGLITVLAIIPVILLQTKKHLTSNS
jgi:MFS transporter, DHA2 family, multidrug resistance protein